MDAAAIFIEYIGSLLCKSGNFSLSNFHSTGCVADRRPCALERASSEGVCVCDAISMRIFLCFSSINKTATINLNIGRRFHAKLCLALASALVRNDRSERMPPKKWNSKFEFIGHK